jgi:hypothetical protein
VLALFYFFKPKENSIKAIQRKKKGRVEVGFRYGLGVEFKFRGSTFNQGNVKFGL